MDMAFRRTSVLLVAVLGLSIVEGRLRVCYFSNWAQYRPTDGEFLPQDVDPFLCTHLIYAFAKLNNYYELDTIEPNDHQLYNDFNNLKTTNEDLKTLIAVGGWNAGSAQFTAMTNNPGLRANFVTTTVDFIKTKGFDGLDLDWEYPSGSDKINFANLVEELRAAFDAENPKLLLSAAVPAGKSNIDNGYDVPRLNLNLDFINLMAYDLHGAWDPFTGFNSPLHARTGESTYQARLNVEWAANYWASLGASKDKMMIGLATYGRSFTLANAAYNLPGAIAIGAGAAGPYTILAGFLAYYEICDKRADNSGTRYWEPEQKVPYLVTGHEWIGYDDEESIQHKVEWIIDEGFGGTMVWAIDLDDFSQKCVLSTRPYPLMNTMKDILLANQPPTTTDVPTTTTTDVPTTTTTDVPTTTTTDVPTTTTTDVPTTTTTDVPTTTETTTTTDVPDTTDAQGTTDVSGTTDTSETTMQTTMQETTSATGTTEPSVTAVQEDFCAGKANGFYKDADDCGKYYRCAGQHTYHTDCTGGLLWNDNLKYCDWDYNVNCGEPSTTETPVTITEDPEVFCEGKENGHYEDVANCNMYFQCWTGVTYHKTCQGTLQWNQNAQYCDYPENVNCGVTDPPATTTDVLSTSPQVLGDEPFCQGKRDGYYKNDEDCGSYYQCWNEAEYTHDCGPGQLFDAHLLSCRLAGDTDCSLQQDMTGFCVGRTGVFPYPFDCKKFYNCAHGIAYIMTCQDPYLYNAAGYCDWVYNVHCGDRPLN